MMNLTNSQIQYIENRLIKNGVKYWDIRIELLDHIVSDVEGKLQEVGDFKKIVHNSFIDLGWNGSFYDLVCNRLKGINKKVRSQYLRKVGGLFTNTISLITIIVFLLFYSYTYQFLSTSIFKKVSLFFLITPLTIFVGQYFYITFNKEKSGLLLYSSFYVFFSFLVLNALIQGTRPSGGFYEVSKETYKLIIFIVTIVNSVFTYAGILVYLQGLKTSKNLYQKLNSL